jgi:two-component system CheB/CheR fusion protein
LADQSPFGDWTAIPTFPGEYAVSSDPVKETPSLPGQHLGETEFQAVRGEKFHALFPLAGIGASAGGLAALKAMFSQIPPDSGLAYVVIVHLSPEHKSHLAELLQPHVQLPVQQVDGTVKLEPNRIYIIPPNANLDTIDTHLRLSPLEESRRERAPIDHFFRTLANTHDGRAIGVILTGTGSDGTLGIRQIKEAGGLTIVQDPNDAEYDGMPQSAISTGLIDLVLPLAEIPEAILGFVSTEPKVVVPESEDEIEDRTRRHLQAVFVKLRARTGRDFGHYKRSTILRRIARRMQFRRIEELANYVEYLAQHPDEVRQLADDMLVNVSNFFRDRDVFEILERDIVPQLFEGKGPDEAVRVWSVGCATGEEAYSLAMLLFEYSSRQPTHSPIQVFASDLHDLSLQKARDGFYPGDIETDVSEERLQRFFQKEDNGYRIRKELREVVVFAPHNVLTDPPFSRMDLISCRNVLIYLQRNLQQDVTELFHYALKPEGLLLVGTSETIDVNRLFRSEDKQCCLYRKRNVPGPEPRLPVFPLTRLPQPSRKESEDRSSPPVSYGNFHQRMVELYAPPSALVTPDEKVVHLSAHAGRYFIHPGGELTSSLFKLLREEFRIELRTLLPVARQSREAVNTRPISIELNGETRSVTIRVRPSLEPNEDGFQLLIFDEGPAFPHAADQDADTERLNSEQGEMDRQLQAELELSRQRLQAIIEEYETGQEEIRASNEELQSANEELRSTLEELETSKEELQSMNEELQTLNQENRHKVEELSQMTGDLNNLLAATEIAMLFLDRQMRIMRFTPKVSELFNVRLTDRSRPLADFTHRLGYDDLQRDVERVLDKLVPIEREVQDVEGRWYFTRILPYRSSEDRIEGAVITFVDITGAKTAEENVRSHIQQFQSLVEQVQEHAIFMLDPEGRGTSWNSGVRRVLGFEESEFVGHDVSSWIFTPEDIAAGIPQAELNTAALTGRANNDRWMQRKDGTRFWAAGMTTALHDHNQQLLGYMKVMRDQTEQKLLQDELTRTGVELAEANRRKDEFLATLAHELRNPLAPLRTGVELLKRSRNAPALIEEVLETMDRQLTQLITLVDDLMDVSRITRGNLKLQKSLVRLSEIVNSAVEASRPVIEQFQHQLAIALPQESITLDASANRLAQVISNLLNNAAKYTPSGGQIRLSAHRENGDVVIAVGDNGVGIPPDKLANVFEMFSQLDSPIDHFNSGLGIGLTLVKSLVELHGGAVEVDSAGKNLGSEFRVRLPCIETLNEVAATADPAIAPATKNPRRMLIVDDNESALMMLKKLLQSLGHEVETASNGEEALRQGERFHPDIILMDLGMPHMDGFEACRRIREQPWGTAIRIAALTGWGQEEDRRRTREAHFDEHLVKPVQVADLQKLLAKK